MKNKKEYFIIGGIILLILVIIIILFNTLTKKDVNYTNFVRTYYIMGLYETDNINYVNLEIKEYNNDKIYTVSVPRNILTTEIIYEEPYEFTFDYNGKRINDSVEEIFKWMSLKSVNICENKESFRNDEM